MSWFNVLNIIGIFKDGISTPVTTTDRLPTINVSSALKSELNSTNIPLDNGEEFIGETEINAYSEILVTLKADQDCKVYVEFSPDEGINWDTSLFLQYRTSRPLIKRYVKADRAYRVRVVNDSGSNMTTLRLHVSQGDVDPITYQLDGVLNKQADAIPVLTIPAETNIVLNRVSGRSITEKHGFNLAVPNSITLTSPADVWPGTGQYKGFPVSTIETLTFVSTSASDTGTVTIRGLRSPTSTEYTEETITLNGTTPVTTITTWWRCISAIYNNSSSNTKNAGTISIYHTTTTANIFGIIPINRGKTQQLVYTVPYKNQSTLKDLKVALSVKNTGNISGHLWVRKRNNSPYDEIPFTISQNRVFEHAPYAGKYLPALTDIAVQLYESSASGNVEIFGRLTIETVQDVDV